MAQSHTRVFDDSTRSRYPPHISDSPSQAYFPIDITEEVINLKPMGADESEEPTRSLLHQVAVTEINDSDSCLLKQRNISGHGGSGGGDSDRLFKDVSETFKDWFTNGWFTEILAVLVSFACAVAIPVVLGVYNHNPVPKLPWDVSLNAVVSVLSTVAKSSLLYTICAALGQDKWDWYDTGTHGLQQQTFMNDSKSKMSHGRERRLKDMETLDQASRGPLGAVKILTSRRTALSPTSLGALVVILSLVVDPFTQQVVSLRERQRLVSSDEVWAARPSAPFFCYRNFEYQTYGSWSMDCAKIFQDAIQAAIWVDPEAYKPPSHAHCPSGNCEWEPFHTIEYCLDNRVIESPTGYCDISFNQSEFNEAYRYYNDTGKHRVMIQDCKHMISPLNITKWSEKPKVVVVDTFRDNEFGGKSMFPNSSQSAYLPSFGSETSVATGFEMAYRNRNYTNKGPSPYLWTRFPTEVITSVPPEENNITNEFGVRIPGPLTIMAHTRYDMVPEVYRSITFSYNVTDWYRPPIELRVNLTEWSALSFCQVERKISVVNGTTVSKVAASKYLQPAYTNIAEEQYNATFWAPEDHIKNNATMFSVLTKDPTGSFSPDEIGPRRYQADNSTGAFCLYKGVFQFFTDPAAWLTQILRATKATSAEGDDDVQIWNVQWGNPRLDDEDPDQMTASRISRRTLPAVMTSITAALNNMNYAATNERITGSYVVRETILVARWEWLTVLFSIEIMGMGYLLYIIFRPRTAAGVWKDSIFAVLYHGLDDGARDTIGHVKNLRDMRKATEYMEVRLDQPKEDNRVVLVRD